MIPKVRNLYIYGGDKYSIKLPMENKGKLTTGLQVKSHIKKQVSSSDIVTEFSVDNSYANKGIIILTLTSQQTQDLVKSNIKSTYVYDIKVFKDIAPDDPFYIVRGKITVYPCVTK